MILFCDFLRLFNVVLGFANCKSVALTSLELLAFNAQKCRGHNMPAKLEIRPLTSLDLLPFDAQKIIKGPVRNPVIYKMSKQKDETYFTIFVGL